jgi:alkylation response protein AidB-like acyl-CoA dehydrogenase
MDYGDTADEAAFRTGFRAWLATHAPSEPLPVAGAARAEAWHEWHKTLYEAGYVGVSWPVEVGGRGLSPLYDAILNEEVGAAGAPPLPHVGFLGRALLHHGSPAQQRRYLPGLLSGDEVWCQGFSEPGAGSDLSALATRGRLEGDVWIVDGQKVWTSDAAWADWCLLLVRTEPEAPRHQGISALLVDMRTPGVTVRPIVQINGDTEFNEVFFDGVRVPADRIVGARGDGWRIAMTTVAYERGPAEVGFSSRYGRTLRDLEQVAAARPADPTIDRALAEAYVHNEVLRLHVLRSLSARLHLPEGAVPGPEGSIDKLLATRTEQLLHHVAMDLHDGAAVLGQRDEVLFEYFYSRAASIAGGTSQIQRGIIAERVLGLPRSS